MHSLIINADDFGLTDGVSRSITELLQSGAISNTTIMICVEGAVSRCKHFISPDLAKYLGVHLQITPELHHRKPLSPASEIPTLVDSSGNFKPKDHSDWIDPREVELEWDRQIIKVAEVLGQKPSHLDSHHGTHRRAGLTPVYLELAARYGIPVRGGSSVNQIVGTAMGVKSSAFATSEWTGQDRGVEEFKHSVLKNLELVGDGVLEIITHPGFCDAELLRSSSWNTVRENDHAVLLQIAEQGWYRDEGMQLISYSDI